MRFVIAISAPWLLILSPFVLSQECRSSDLLGWWPAEADAADGAGDNDGELVGATFEAGRVGLSFSLDGEAYVEIDNADDLRVSAETPSTLEAWIYPTSLPANSYVPIGPSLPYYYGILYNTGDRLLRANVNDGSRWYYFDAAFQLPLNEWTHVAQTWDGAELRIYANGQLIGTGSQNGDIYPRLDLPAYIGRWLVTEGNPQEFKFTGLIDEVRIYKAMLEDSDIHASYLAGIDGEVCIKSHVPFRRGDANGDDRFDISDAINILGCLFLGTDCAKCQDALDANDDGQTNIADPTYLLNWRFLSGRAPPAPFVFCGIDATPDQLDECEAFSTCP